MATNPLIAQGVLNRLRASVVCPNFGNLNITASYMGKNMVTVAFEGDFVVQQQTATGVVNSPEPYIPVTVTVALLRTQKLASDWFTQSLTNSSIGDVTVHSDTSAFPQIALSTMVIRRIDPGPFNGSGPDVNLTLGGIMYANNNLWAFA
jgi:hypothetical protein